MSKRKFRKINSKTVRNMLSWSHYKFRELLKSKCQEYKNKHCIEMTEEHTSKTCTSCGNYKFDLGGNKEYHCKKCEKTIDRDVNGARNILLKVLVESTGKGIK